MMRKTAILAFFVLAVSAARPLFAGPVVVADAQLVAVSSNEFVLRLRSSGPLAFDVVSIPNSPDLGVRLYQAKLGEVPELNPLPFGAISWTAEAKGDLLLRLSLKDPGFRAKVCQGAGPGVVEIKIKWAPDKTPPVISASAASKITSTGAVIVWRTDEPSDSQVVYGLTKPENQAGTVNPSLVTAHAISLSGLTPGKTYYFHVRSADASGNVSVSPAVSFTTPPAAFQEAGGQVSIEAEHYDIKTPRGGIDWVLQRAQVSYSGSGYLTALPNTGTAIGTGFTAASPELVYNIHFTTAGTYYVWIRGRAGSTSDDSVHAGIDGAGPQTSDNITGFKTLWGWTRSTSDGPAASIVVSKPGLHTFHLWMREDGFQADKIFLTMNGSSTAPAGVGPAESARS